MDKRVFLSVLAALVVFGLLVIGWRALERDRDREDAQAALQSINDYVGQAVQQSAADLQEQRRQSLAQQQAQSLQSIRDRDRGLLAADQRCIGGTVIAVKGSIYTQVVGRNGRPVPCQGRMAEQPLR